MTREIEVVVEITIQIMNSFSYAYVQKEKKCTHVVYLTNVCSKYKQTKERKRGKRNEDLPSANYIK